MKRRILGPLSVLTLIIACLIYNGYAQNVVQTAPAVPEAALVEEPITDEEAQQLAEEIAADEEAPTEQADPTQLISDQAEQIPTEPAHVELMTSEQTSSSNQLLQAVNNRNTEQVLTILNQAKNNQERMLLANQPEPQTAMTPLHAAAQKGYNEIIMILLEAGAKSTLYNNQKKTARDLAQEAYDQLRKTPVDPSQTFKRNYQNRQFRQIIASLKQSARRRMSRRTPRRKTSKPAPKSRKISKKPQGHKAPAKKAGPTKKELKKIQPKKRKPSEHKKQSNQNKK